jgi:octaprenyl-diphosphate synthase
MKAAAQTIANTSQNPLKDLSDHFAGDMASVNDLIMNRMQSDVAMIPQLAAYLIASGGKRIRPLLTIASASLYGEDGSHETHLLAAAVEFIHTATLLHDDVVDESTQRRGQDSANMVFGNQASVLVGDFLFSRAFELMVETNNINALGVLSKASAIIAEGEVLQLANTGNTALAFDTYIDIIKAKTAALFSAACEVGPIINAADSTQQDTMKAYGENLGIAFQIADDAMDYLSSAGDMGKSVGDDFREGKLTAPVLLAMKDGNVEDQKFWTRVMGDPSAQKDSDLERAITLIAQYDSVQKSLTLAEDYGSLAKEALSAAPQNSVTEMLIGVVDQAIHRTA